MYLKLFDGTILYLKHKIIYFTIILICLIIAQIYFFGIHFLCNTQTNILYYKQIHRIFKFPIHAKRKIPKKKNNYSIYGTKVLYKSCFFFFLLFF
jgi:hypothetical protein